MTSTVIREGVPADRPGIEALYPAAFPDEDLLPLVRSLLEDADNATSLIAEVDAEIVGNVIFTFGSVAGSNQRAALLAPLAVNPAKHRQGIGSELVRSGLAAMQGAGVDVVCVLGDPAYYGRFGFVAERDIEPPYALPPEWRDAWQSQSTSGTTGSISGRLTLPEPWLQPSLWRP